MSAVRVAIAGCGFIGAVHARAIRRAGLTLVALADPDTARARELAGDSGVAVRSSLTEVLDDPDLAVDAVAVCSPPGEHAALVIEAARHGCHVLAEKPLAPTSADARRAVEACDQAGVCLAVGFKMRFEETFRTAYDVIRAGEIGAPRHLHITHHQPAPAAEWTRRTGVAAELLVHSIDLSRWYLGADPVGVAARLGADSLSAELRLAFGDDRSAILTGRWIDGFAPVGGGRDLVLQVVGTTGHLVVLRPDLVRVSTPAGSRDIGVGATGYDEPFVQEWLRFADLVAGRDPGALARGADGLAAQALLDTIHAQAGRPVRARHDPPAYRRTVNGPRSPAGTDPAERAN